MSHGGGQLPWPHLRFILVQPIPVVGGSLVAVIKLQLLLLLPTHIRRGLHFTDRLFCSIRFRPSLHFVLGPQLATLLSPLCAPPLPPPIHSSAYFKGYCEGATNQPKESSSSISIHSLTVNELAHLRVDSHLAPGGAIIPHSPFYHIGPIIFSHPTIQLAFFFHPSGAVTLFRAQTLFFPRPFFLHAPFSSLLRRPFEWAAKCHQLMWAKCGSI